MAARCRIGAELRGLFTSLLARLGKPVPPLLGDSASVRLTKGVRAFRCNTAELQSNQLPGGLEYIPKRKAKHPMKNVGVAWALGLPSGILIFLLAKRQVDSNRLKQLKVRRRMKDANTGEYRSERYRQDLAGAKAAGEV